MLYLAVDILSVSVARQHFVVVAIHVPVYVCGLTGQVVNMLREDRMAKCSNAYRPHLTSHITLPSRHRAGITLFVSAQSPAFDKLQHSTSTEIIA